MGQLRLQQLPELLQEYCLVFFAGPVDVLEPGHDRGDVCYACRAAVDCNEVLQLLEGLQPDVVEGRLTLGDGESSTDALGCRYAGIQADAAASAAALGPAKATGTVCISCRLCSGLLYSGRLLWLPWFASLAALAAAARDADVLTVAVTTARTAAPQTAGAAAAAATRTTGGTAVSAVLGTCAIAVMLIIAT